MGDYHHVPFGSDRVCVGKGVGSRGSGRLRAPRRDWRAPRRGPDRAAGGVEGGEECWGSSASGRSGEPRDGVALRAGYDGWRPYDHGNSWCVSAWPVCSSDSTGVAGRFWSRFVIVVDVDTAGRVAPVAFVLHDRGRRLPSLFGWPSTARRCRGVELTSCVSRPG